MKTVLLVEDCDDDVLLTQTACQNSGVAHTLNVVSDGQSAIDYLAGINHYVDRARHPLPELIFLDVKLPKRDGHEVLQWIREQRRFRRLPVIMLTAFADPTLIEQAYELGATSYLLKNSNIHKFDEGVRIILKYWLELNCTPV